MQEQDVKTTEGQDAETKPFDVESGDISWSASINKVAAALAKAQGQMVAAAKDSDNPFFRSRYADLASCWEACRTPLSVNELSVVQLPATAYLTSPEPYEWTSKQNEKRFGVRAVTRVTVTTVLLHSSGQWIRTVLSTLLPVADAQTVGAAITYLRRYSLSPLVGVAAGDDDDDGEATATSNPGRAERPKKPTGPAGPEVVKGVRPVKPANGPEYFVLETSQRQYVTDDPDMAKSLTESVGKSVDVASEPIKTNFGTRLKLVEFTLVAGGA